MIILIIKASYNHNFDNKSNNLRLCKHTHTPPRNTLKTDIKASDNSVMCSNIIIIIILGCCKCKSIIIIIQQYFLLCFSLSVVVMISEKYRVFVYVCVHSRAINYLFKYFIVSTQENVKRKLFRENVNDRVDTEAEQHHVPE